MQNEPVNSEIAFCPIGSNSQIFAFEFERAELFDDHHHRLDSNGIMSNIYIRQQCDNVKKKKKKVFCYSFKRKETKKKKFDILVK